MDEREKVEREQVEKGAFNRNVNHLGETVRGDDEERLGRIINKATWSG